jgi:hypothetical protein
MAGAQAENLVAEKILNPLGSRAKQRRKPMKSGLFAF